MAKTVETKASETILEEPKRIKVGNRTYLVPPPCAATLIKVSQLLGGVPPIDANENRLNEVLATAKDSGCLFEIVAVLILGAKAIRDEQRERSICFWRRFRKSKYDKLIDSLKYEASPSEVYSIVAEILSMMEINDFFALSISLKEIRMIQQTREMETNPTQFGRS